MAANRSLQVYDGFGELNSVSGSTGTLPAGLNLGTIRQEGGVKYVLCYNKGNSAMDAGMLCMNTTPAAGTMMGPYSVTITTVTESIAGVRGCVANATVPTGYYFWMAVKGGPVNLRASNISLKTGHMVGPAAAGLCVTTDTSANYVGYNAGTEGSSATACTDATPTNPSFWVDFESIRPNV